jgi:hypothetical protein
MKPEKTGGGPRLTGVRTARSDEPWGFAGEENAGRIVNDNR